MAAQTRLMLIRRILRLVYGGLTSIDANITDSLVNQYLQDAFAFVAKKNYNENGQIDGIEYVNNSYYTTYSGLSISTSISEDFCYVFTIPQVPVGLGNNEGIATIRFMDTSGNYSQEAIPLSLNQVGYYRNMRPIPNKTMYWYEGNTVFNKSVVNLTGYTAVVKMVSAGDNTNLNSIVNVPDDAMPDIINYVKLQLSTERQTPKTPTDDGADA